MVATTIRVSRDATRSIEASAAIANWCSPSSGSSMATTVGRSSFGFSSRAASAMNRNVPPDRKMHRNVHLMTCASTGDESCLVQVATAPAGSLRKMVQPAAPRSGCRGRNARASASGDTGGPQGRRHRDGETGCHPVCRSLSSVSGNRFRENGCFARSLSGLPYCPCRRQCQEVHSPGTILSRLSWLKCRSYGRSVHAVQPTWPAMTIWCHLRKNGLQARRISGS